MSESWVINASPVILLAKVGLMERVPSLAENLVIPQPVADEILSIGGSDAATRWLNGPGTRLVRPPVPELASVADSLIGPGERAVISWASVHPGFTAVLDDRQARIIAERLGVKVFGTVGVVVRLKKAGLISEVKTHLLQIKSAGGYLSDELLAEALHATGESP